jgi:hypothetical protein
MRLSGLDGQGVAATLYVMLSPRYAWPQDFCSSLMCKWFFLFCLIYPLATTAEKGKELAITHVTVIDCTGAAPKPNSTVIIGNGHISVLGPSDRVTIPAGVRVIDGSGKFLIPGLWDMHGHLTDATEDAFPLLIMNGVTGVRDMGGDLAQIDR